MSLKFLLLLFLSMSFFSFIFCPFVCLSVCLCVCLRVCLYFYLSTILYSIAQAKPFNTVQPAQADSFIKILIRQPISMGECNTILSAYTLYRHLGWCCTHPSICKSHALTKRGLMLLRPSVYQIKTSRSNKSIKSILSDN